MTYNRTLTVVIANRKYLLPSPNSDSFCTLDFIIIEGLKMAQNVSNFEKTTQDPQRPTMAISLGFLLKLSSQVFYRDSHTNPYIFVGFPSY